MSFSQKLRTLRLSKNINMSELARQIGVSRSIISKYESGDRFPSIEIVKLMADYFSVSLDYLLGSDGEDKEKSPPDGELVNHDLQTIYRLFSSLDEGGRRRAFEYLDMLLLKQRQESKENTDNE